MLSRVKTLYFSQPHRPAGRPVARNVVWSEGADGGWVWGGGIPLPSGGWAWGVPPSPEKFLYFLL